MKVPMGIATPLIRKLEIPFTLIRFEEKKKLTAYLSLKTLLVTDYKRVLFSGP